MGNFAERMARETSAEVVATDLSPRMVELTRERGVAARVADVQALPFADASFAGCIAQAVLEHVVDPGRAHEHGHLGLAGVDRADCLVRVRRGSRPAVPK